MIPLIKPIFPPIESYLPTFEEIHKSGHFSNSGEVCRKLEMKLEAYLEVDNAILVTNGTMALVAALKATRIRKDAVVMVPNFTFAATIQAITMCGFTARIADIDPETLTIDVNTASEWGVDAVLAVNTFGYSCHYDELQEFCDRKNIPFIIDAAGALGSEYKCQSVAGLGDISCFSLHATKLLPVGEGGLITTNDDHTADYIRKMINFGIDDQCIDPIGFNGKMDEFRSAIGLAALENLDQHLLNRDKYASRYRRNMEGYDVKFQKDQEFSFGTNQLFCMIFETNDIRNAVQTALDDSKIGSKVYYTPFYDTHENLPVTDKIHDTILCVPMHSEMDVKDIDRVCDVIKRVLNEA